MVTDNEYIAKYVEMLKVFKALVKSKPPVASIKGKLDELRSEAMNTIYLTAAQRRGITDRCDYYEDGTYVVKE